MTFLEKLRVRVGAWLIGGDYLATIARLWLIRERAKAAVASDGTVVLAECASLAEALYEPLPGSWDFTLQRSPERPR